MNWQPLTLEPEYRAYVWGGERLKPGERIGEAWVVWQDDRIANGALAGLTLGEAARRYPDEIVGRGQGGTFPLLIKLLDCQEWLSVQVHPDDALAVELAGAGARGKEEAWHFLEAAPGAEIICGFTDGAAEVTADAAILARLARRVVTAGESVTLAAGLVHALGPGLFVYEVQQSSDLTYRLYDWGRPETAARPLHRVEAARAARPGLRARWSPAGAVGVVAAGPYFALERLVGAARLAAHTGGRSFHAVTVSAGSVTVACGGAAYRLGRWQTLLIPAVCGRYELRLEAEAALLRARLNV